MVSSFGSFFLELILSILVATVVESEIKIIEVLG